MGDSDLRAAAFFDLDRTLILPNSGMLYAKFERRHGRISALMFAKSGFWALLYHFSLIDIREVTKQLVGHYAGVSEAKIKERTRLWFEDEISDLLLPGARKALDEHAAEGHPTVILTSSSCYEAEFAAKAWKIDHWLANFFEIDDEGCFTGGVIEPLCYGDGKIIHAERWLEGRGISLDKSYFYSDSYSDAPMLERVGNPRVVNPDPRLRRLARRRGWPILDWRET
jgi:HAD superfamily hydrolase (TIGR01490 family)